MPESAAFPAARRLRWGAGVTAPSAPIISVRDVTRAFDGRVVVDDLTFEVNPGTILGVVGPSGSGKTTTIRMLTGTLGRGKGEISVMGEDPMRFSRRVRGRLAYMPQLFSLYEDLSAQENVGFVAALYGIGPFRAHAVESSVRSRSSISSTHATSWPVTSPAGCSAASSSRARSSTTPRCSSSMSRPPASTRSCARPSGTSCAACGRRDGRWSSRPNTSSEAEYCDQVALILDGELVALDAPEALRRMAFGGDVLQITTDRAVDPDLLATVAGVQNVRQPGPRTLIATVSDAGALTPRIVEAIRVAGIGVAGIEEQQPTFDEVFTELVGQRRAQAQRRRHRWVASSASAPSSARSSAR